MPESAKSHYDKRYFDWQAPMGEFGGWANRVHFVDYISPDSRVLDFGCGGGFLLSNLQCGKRIGVEVNPSAADVARSKGVEIFSSASDLPDSYVDVVISNSALEHTKHPLDELRNLHRALSPCGKIVFVVPCEAISYRYEPNDINQHLYTWSPMCLGNLFTEAGFRVIESKPYMHKWPPQFKCIARIGGEDGFQRACRVYGHLERLWLVRRLAGRSVIAHVLFQVRVVAEKAAGA